MPRAKNSAGGMVPTGEPVRPLGDALTLPNPMIDGFRSGVILRDPDPEADPGADDSDEFDEYEQINHAIGEIAEHGVDGGKPPKTFVYRLREGKRDAFLYECLVTDWAQMGLVHIRDTYGAGEYRIRVYHAGKIRVNRTVAIEAPLVPAVAPAAPGAASDSTIRDLAKTFETGLTQVMQGFSAAIRDLQTTREPPKSTLDTLKELAAMRDLLAPPPAPAATDPMKMFQMALEMAEKLRDTGDPEGSFPIRMMERFGGPLLEMLQQGRQTVPTANPAQPALPAPVPNPEPVPKHDAPVVRTNPEGLDPETEEMMIAVRMFLRRACASAASNGDPVVTAEEIYDFAPDDMLAQLVDDPQWLDKLAEINPQVRNFAPWFDKVRSELKNILTEQAEPDNPSPDKKPGT